MRRGLKKELTFKIGGPKNYILKKGDQKFKNVKIGEPKIHLNLIIGYNIVFLFSTKKKT
jgi:hypothetical protein